MTVVRAVPVDENTGKMRSDLLPANAATTTALSAVSSTATNAATAATSASTAASAALTAANAKLAKPANPTAPAVPVIAPNGTVTTALLSSLGGGSSITLNERGPYSAGTYAVGDAFTWQGGRYLVHTAFTGGSTPDLTKTISTGLDQSAALGVTITDLGSGSGTMKVPFTDAGLAKLFTVTGTVSLVGGGGGLDSNYTGNTVALWNTTGSATDIAPTVGTAHLTGGVGVGDPYMRSGMQGGFYKRGTVATLSTVLDTPVQLEPGSNATMAVAVIRDVWTLNEHDGHRSHLLALGNNSDSMHIDLERPADGSAPYDPALLRVWRGVGSPITAPLTEGAGNVDAGNDGEPFSPVDGDLTGGWYVLAVVFSPSGNYVRLAKPDGTTLLTLTGFDATGLGLGAQLNIDGAGLGSSFSGTARYRRIGVFTDMTPAKINSVIADYAAAANA